jgi:hypothetical protein
MGKILAMAAGAALTLAAGTAMADEAKGEITQIDNVANRIHLMDAGKEFIFSMSPTNTAGVKIGDLMVGDSVMVFYSSSGRSDISFNALHVAKEE